MRGVLVALFLGVAMPQMALATDPGAEQVNRGRYLVEGVGVCADCHTPRNERGEPEPGAHLAGAPIGFRPLHPMPEWAEYAPRIAGLPGIGTEDAVKLFETGDLNGRRLRPPMPPYRLSREDAAAVVAYLRWLTLKAETAEK